MTKFRCTVCNFVYDEEKEGIKFDDLPSDWVCPICSAPKSAFVPLGEERVEEAVTPTVADKIVEQLTALDVKYVFGTRAQVIDCVFCMSTYFSHTKS
jgi:pyruvate oxidase